MNKFLCFILFSSLVGCSAQDGDWNEVSSKMEETAVISQPIMSPSLPLGQVELVSQEGLSFPESAIVLGNYVCVSGPASFDIPPGEPVFLTCYNRWNGLFVKRIQIPAVVPFVPNPGSVAAPGALGDVYINVSNPVASRVVRLSTVFDFWENHSAPLRDVPPCSLGLGGECSATGPCVEGIPGAPPCSAELGRGPLLNGMVAMEDGTLFVTDSFQASIWRIPADPDVASGERVPELWFTSPQLEGNIYSPFPAGPNGLAIGPDGMLYVANTTAGPDYGGALYRLPLTEVPVEADLEFVTSWPAFTVPGLPNPLPEGPDGLKFDVDGNLWLTLAFGNAVVKLTMSSNGVVVGEERFYHNPEEGVPFHQPSELVLDPRQKAAFFPNHALEPATPANWALFKMGTQVKGAPLQKPLLPWDCAVHDCAGIDWGETDFFHVGQLLLEEATGL